MRRRVPHIILAIGILAVGVLAVVLVALRGRPLSPEDVLAAYQKGSGWSRLSVDYPLDGTLFPPEIAPPTFRWQDGSGADSWLVSVEFEDGGDRLSAFTDAAEWTPSDEQWEQIKRRSLEKDARVTVIGLAHASPANVVSVANIAIRISGDEVGASLFYREVNLPFVDAVKDPSHIRWRFGTVSAKGPPPVVLEGLPVCANCHSFSADGSILGMDVDYANDKGSYAITRVKEEMLLTKDKVITWSDYKREDAELTFGLLSQVSPDGRYVVSTVKDRSVFVPTPGLEFSQLFFPIKGILVVYDRQTGEFHALSGADDKEFVQSNPTWSPDGKHIVFARSEAYPLEIAGDKVLLGKDECREFLEEGRTFLFDLYRVPFNNGEGGVAEPLEGASANGISNYFARYSPDGKWIVFCRARSFMLLQPDSELYIMPAEGGRPRRMRCNTPRMNSWHSWSPNGRWLVFSSKANGPYTQLFLTHVDEEGNDTPAVLLANLTSSDRAANIPEFVNAAPGTIARISERFIDDLSFVGTGQEFLKNHDYGDAAEAFRTALEMNPLNPRAHDGLGIALAEQGRLVEAVQHHAEAIRLDPDDATAHSNLGAALAMQGNSEEAAECFRTALRLSPDDAEAHFNLGLSLAVSGAFEEAIAYYREAIRLKPDYARAHNNLGITLATQGRLDEAIQHFVRALEIEPEFEKAQGNLERARREKEERTQQ